MDRAARLGDGWIPRIPASEAAAAVEDILDRREAAGHPRVGFGIQVQARLQDGGAEDWTAAAWRAAGATRVSATSMNAGFTDLAAYLRAIETWQQVITS